MSRFDPNTYPDRLAFEAYAHRVRARELGELFHAASAWVMDREHAIAGQLGKYATATLSDKHRHSTH